MTTKARMGAERWLVAVVLAAALGAARAAPPPPLVPMGYKVERVVMLYRHGLRAPLADEAGARDYARASWPTWSTPASLLTPHGREGMRQLGLYDGGWLRSLGLLSRSGCPTAADVGIWTNTEARTISSGEALAAGIADGCELTVGHRPTGERDPLFDADAAQPDLDAAVAVRNIDAETGGPAALVALYAHAVHTLQTILGCDRDPHPCAIGEVPSRLGVGDDGRGLKLEGPIQITSGTAEVFLLQYGENMPLARVGWGRATPERLAEVSRLHALLFDIYDRPTVMARRTAAAMAPTVSHLVDAEQGPRIMLLVGHDNNIAALASLLGAHFRLPGYALDDPPLGGALGFLVLSDPHGGRFVRVFYQAQTLDQLRRLTRLTLATPPAVQVLMPSCADGPTQLCTLGRFRAALSWPGQQGAAPISSDQ